MRHLGSFVLCEGAAYQALEPDPTGLVPRSAPGAADDGLDGWGFLARSGDRRLALLYFEQGAVLPALNGLLPDAAYAWRWFDPRAGRWLAPLALRTDASGVLRAPAFPAGGMTAARDWAAKLKHTGR
jgi:hypothetical protein